MKGIDKNKHAQLLRGLHELLAITSDPDDARRVEAEIDALTASYERYRNLIAESLQCAATYNARHGSIRSMLSRELRRARRLRGTDTRSETHAIIAPAELHATVSRPAALNVTPKITPLRIGVSVSSPAQNRA